LADYVSATSGPHGDSSTSCEPPSPRTAEPVEVQGPNSTAHLNYYGNPNITLPSWRAFASFTAPVCPAPETTIQATRPTAPRELALIHSAWHGLPTDLEPYFGSWLGLTGQHEIPIASLGQAWGHWLTSCAQEYCKGQSGRVHVANYRAKNIAPTLNKSNRKRSSEDISETPSIPMAIPRLKRRRSI
jgi:hypothetical protein